MNLQALQHLTKAAQSLADDCQIIVLGSASLLASFPDLGRIDGPLASTFDADLCPRPFDETTGQMLEEALGESHAFHLRHGYHADILRDEIFATLPPAWMDRLVSVPGCTNVLAIDPHDLAAVKLMLARPKDLALLRLLYQKQLIHADLAGQRLDSIPKSEKSLLLAARAFEQVFGG
jgi:hypothetical protein